MKIDDSTFVQKWLCFSEKMSLDLFNNFYFDFFLFLKVLE